jgi:hypothetical protein
VRASFWACWAAFVSGGLKANGKSSRLETWARPLVGRWPIALVLEGDREEMGNEDLGGDRSGSLGGAGRRTWCRRRPTRRCHSVSSECAFVSLNGFCFGEYKEQNRHLNSEPGAQQQGLQRVAMTQLRVQRLPLVPSSGHVVASPGANERGGVEAPLPDRHQAYPMMNPPSSPCTSLLPAHVDR